MKKLLLLIGVLVLFAPLVHAGQYDGKWEGETRSCRINFDNFSARYELTIKNDHATMYQYHSNTNKNQIHKGKVHGFTKKNKLGLNGSLGHISGKFTSSDTLLFKYDDSENCSVRMTKINKSTNTDTAKKILYCKNNDGEVFQMSYGNKCGFAVQEITKIEYDLTIKLGDIKTTIKTTCKKLSGEMYETNRGYCLSTESVVMLPVSTISQLPKCEIVNQTVKTNTACYGTITHPSGNKYVGEFKNGMYHGHGTFTWTDGENYVGEHKYGESSGHGTYTWADGETYVGAYWKDKRHGLGTYTYDNGDKFVGEYRNGKKNGFGTYTYVHGDKFAGEYRNGKRDGFGTYTYADGVIDRGEWKNGDLVKKSDPSKVAKVETKTTTKKTEQITKSEFYCVDDINRIKFKKIGNCPSPARNIGATAWNQGGELQQSAGWGVDQENYLLFTQVEAKQFYKKLINLTDKRYNTKSSTTVAQSQTKKNKTTCKKLNGEMYETNRGYCRTTETVVMDPTSIVATSDIVNYCINIPKQQKQITTTDCPFGFWRVGKSAYDKRVYNQYVELKNTTSIVATSTGLTKTTTTKKTLQTVIVKNDTTGPEIIVAKTFEANQYLSATIKGRVRDESEIALVSVDGDPVSVSNGSFSKSLFVQPEGQTVEIVSMDKHGNRSTATVELKRTNVTVVTKRFDSPDPRKMIVKTNPNAVALIIGVEDYENTVSAPFARKDALAFNDFARMSLGVPQNNIKLLINEDAERTDTLKAFSKNGWLPKVVDENKTDLFVFFSGHGLASEDGKDLYLLPYDGDPEFLEDSTLFRNRIFQDIDKLNPRSVTVFLDTCYSGATRSEEFLMAAKPIFIEVAEQEIPNNFTVFSASAGKETAKILEEAEHGLFSYFLMKGLEGEADENDDQQITNEELIAFIYKNVSRQANQTPQLAGDSSRVLVQW